MSDLKPKWPGCDTRQYATDNDAGHHISMGYDENNNEIPGDTMMMHEGSTPGQGSFNYSAKHYANEFTGGYGVNVGGSEASREKTNVEAQSTERGKES